MVVREMSDHAHLRYRRQALAVAAGMAILLATAMYFLYLPLMAALARLPG
jgi:hypothetical protein